MSTTIRRWSPQSDKRENLQNTVIELLTCREAEDNISRAAEYIGGIIDLLDRKGMLSNAEISELLDVSEESVIRSSTAPVTAEKALRDLMPFVLEDYYPELATPEFRAAVEQAQSVVNPGHDRANQVGRLPRVPMPRPR